ncbi:chemotaxis protein [Hafnia alvei]|uniref:Two-component system, chemotaxis family, response regulator CheV n=1 Tax=Hafnia alvei TaxID=569 RepID=A0A1C6YV46_HAFAL|nr:chemotaxis protein [Hafnia alvei]NLS54572.1 response regulator [Hafnia alvei]SCM50728.1 two-component system, chemotaxis family, response regulator CheV [Hafnia alvei]
MDSFQKDIDERANLALSNKFELLLFRLGTSQHDSKSELYGINVFKLREIVPMQKINRAAGMVSPLLGVVNIRDQIMPVIDLPAALGCTPETGLNLLLITEYARSTQAFAVEAVDNIIRLDWSQVHTAEAGVSSRNITSIASMEDENGNKDLALVLDVEQILYDIIPSGRDVDIAAIKEKSYALKPGAIAIVAEDSKVARSMLEQGLKGMGIPTLMHTTGLEAWEKIQSIAAEAKAAGQSITDRIGLVLTDIEMPEMDGFTLTRNIKNEATLKQIPVVIHSSLSGSANEDHVRKVGANGYVAKFDVAELSEVIHKALADVEKS